MSIVRQIGINILTKWSSFLIRAIVGILLVPFLIRELGRELYGLSIILGVIVSFAEVADIGLRTALGRFLAETLAVRDTNSYNRFASTAAIIWIGIGIVMAFACLVSAFDIVDLLNISEGIRWEATVLIATFGSASILCVFIQPLLTAIISSHNRFDTLSKIEAVSYLASAVLLFFALRFTDYGIFAWALIMLGTRIAAIGAQIIFSKRLVPTLEVSIRHFDFTSLGRLFSLSSYLFLLQVTNLLSVRADPLILTRFLGAASLALYTPGEMLSSKIRPLVNVLADQLYPVTTGFEATGKVEEMSKLLFIGTRLTFGLGVGVFAVSGIFSQSICRVWLEAVLGNDYRIAGQILLGWALVDLTQAAAGTQWSVLIAKQKVKFLAWTQIVLAIVNIIASIWLVKHTTLGVLGVIIPTVFINILRRFYVTYYVAYVTNISFVKFIIHSYFRPFIVAVIIFPISFILASYADIQNIVDLVITLAPVFILFLILFYLIVITPDEKSYILPRLKKRLGRRSRG